MVTVELYQSGRSQSISFPQSWNELMITELHKLAQSILFPSFTEHQSKCWLFLELLKIRSGSKKLVQKLDAEDCVLNGLPLLDFVYQGNSLTVQPYKKLRLPGTLRCMLGPADDFNSITVAEFEDAEIFFHQFQQNPQAGSLSYLAAILYRPAGKPYLTINSNTMQATSWPVDKYQKKMAKLPAWELYTIYLWYAGCRQQLLQVFPNVFGDAGTGNDAADPAAFTKCIHAAAGQKNGTRQQVRLTPLKELLFDLEQQAIQAQELEKLYKNAR
jgi:hypothetical protein